MPKFTKRTAESAYNPNQVGKGDTWRTLSTDEFRQNFDSIDWGHKATRKPKLQSSNSNYRKAIEEAAATCGLANKTLPVGV